MPIPVKEDITTVHKGLSYHFEQNVSVFPKSVQGIIRCNVYRPKGSEKVPVIMTYGPYGKDTHTSE